MANRSGHFILSLTGFCMLIPFGTDAPIYHRPYGTVAVMIINVLLFILTGTGDVMGNPFSEYRWLILEFDRINPLQWISSCFMHASWTHLIGNMIFLWCFGLVVEGKIGFKKFSCLYLGLCLADGAIAQIPMFVIANDVQRELGGALGASGVIFALIAVSLCWAPENCMQCLFTWSFYYVRSFDVPIVMLAAFYFCMEILPLLFGGFHMSTPLLHLLGMSVGFPFALYMLKYDLVDCEGWDIISRWDEMPRNPLAILGRLSQSHERRASGKILADAYDRQSGRDALEEILQNPNRYNLARSEAKPTKRPSDERSQVLLHFASSIERKNPNAAKSMFRRIREQWGTHSITERQLVRYATLLSRIGWHVDSLEPLHILVSRKSQHANQACLRIARIQLQIQRDPESAEATLRQLVHPWGPDVECKRQQVCRALQAIATRRTSSIFGGGRSAQTQAKEI